MFSPITHDTYIGSLDNSMKRRLIPILSPESLVSMPTKQLLGRLHSLQRCEQSPALSDRGHDEAVASEGILFKSSAEWQRAYADLKALLATREHVPSAAERANARQQRAKKKSNKRAGGADGTAPLRRARRSLPAAPHHGR